MPDVKPEPAVPYRKWQAQQTKHRIAVAARKVFGAGGYAATSLELVAHEAGVSPRTIFAAFGDKKAILAAICDNWLAESDVGRLAADIMAEPNPARRLTQIALLNRRQWELGQDVIPMLAAAAASDAGVAQMLAGWKSTRAGMLKDAVTGFRGKLRRGVTMRRAVATVRALSAPEIYTELVKGEGWSADAYEHWLAELLIWELLGV